MKWLLTGAEFDRIRPENRAVLAGVGLWCSQQPEGLRWTKKEEIFSYLVFSTILWHETDKFVKIMEVF